MIPSTYSLSRYNQRGSIWELSQAHSLTQSSTRTVAGGSMPFTSRWFSFQFQVWLTYFLRGDFSMDRTVGEHIRGTWSSSSEAARAKHEKWLEPWPAQSGWNGVFLFRSLRSKTDVRGAIAPVCSCPKLVVLQGPRSQASLALWRECWGLRIDYQWG